MCSKCEKKKLEEFPNRYDDDDDIEENQKKYKYLYYKQFDNPNFKGKVIEEVYKPDKKHKKHHQKHHDKHHDKHHEKDNHENKHKNKHHKIYLNSDNEYEEVEHKNKHNKNKVYDDEHKIFLNKKHRYEEIDHKSKHYDKKIIYMMIRHHEKEIKMCQEILKKTNNKELEYLAKKKIISQVREIEKLKSIF
ncbi:Hypothetical protein KVN_LOCUS24 [uncultured virus]|nr:Hypothetical protein KVN_LOCUS24 [uncultured virus]